MSGHGEKRSRQTEAAITALLTCPTLEAAAEQAGIAPATLRRWLAEDEFLTRYRSARAQVVDHAVLQLQQAASDAVEALTRNLSCGVPAAEISAAKAVLDQAFRGMTVLDQEARLEQLERSQARGDEA